jgi:hypothetical protein
MVLNKALKLSTNDDITGLELSFQRCTAHVRDSVPDKDRIAAGKLKPAAAVHVSADFLERIWKLRLFLRGECTISGTGT